MKVWIVESRDIWGGEHIDFAVEAVYSNEEAAWDHIRQWECDDPDCDENPEPDEHGLCRCQQTSIDPFQGHQRILEVEVLDAPVPEEVAS